MGASDTDQAQQTQDQDQDQSSERHARDEAGVARSDDGHVEGIDVDKRLDETRSEDDEDRELTEAPEVTDEHREKAKEMAESYQEDRPTVTLPGSGNTVAGTAINDWLDEDGNPKFGKED